MKYSLVALVVGIFLLGVSCSEPPVEAPAVIDDITKAAAENAKRILENEYVAVTSFELAPRQKLAMHEGGDRVVYSMSRYRLRLGTPDGTPEVKEFNEGDTNWYTAGLHEITNAGATTAKYITVEQKKPWPPSEKESGLLNAVRGFGKMAINNNDVRIVEVGLIPKGRVAKHHGSNRVMISVTPLKIRYTADAGAEEKEFQAGEAHWHEAGDHAIQSLSKEHIRFLVVEFKQ